MVLGAKNAGATFSGKNGKIPHSVLSRRRIECFFSSNRSRVIGNVCPAQRSLKEEEFQEGSQAELQGMSRESQPHLNGLVFTCKMSNQ